VKCSCLDQVAHSKGSSNLLSKTRIQDLDLRERERERALDLMECLAFFEWPTAQGGRWGLFIVPTLNRDVGESFTRLVQWGTKLVW
jgi:hypothetical protein